MPRLSITLTESQAATLDRIAAETGATKQSMIGLAVTSWIRANEHLAAAAVKEPENVPHAVCEVCGAPAEWASVGVDDKEHLYCDNHSAHHLLKCEVCGAPAVGGCIGPDGQHLYCEGHRWMFEDEEC